MKEQLLHEAGTFCRRFVVIYGFTMLASLMFMLLFNRDALLDIQFLFDMILFSLAADATCLVHLSFHELNEREYRLRTLLNIVLCELVLLPLGYYFGMWRGWMGFFLFFFVVLAVNGGVRLVGYGIDAVHANDLNQLIQERRKNEERNT